MLAQMDSERRYQASVASVAGPGRLFCFGFPARVPPAARDPLCVLDGSEGPYAHRPGPGPEGGRPEEVSLRQWAGRRRRHGRQRTAQSSVYRAAEDGGGAVVHSRQTSVPDRRGRGWAG
jgi:hypothetical protein